MFENQEKDKLENKLKRSKKISARFAVISDVHITHIKEGYDLFENSMRIMSKLQPDGYVFAGDIVYMIEKAGGGICSKLYPVVYDYFQEIVGKYIGDTPFVYAIGNHEFPQHNTEKEITQEARRLFEEKTGCALREHKYICGYHFISLDIESWQCVVPKETEEWAQREIEKAVEQSGDKPVFVVMHVPPHETVAGSDKTAVSISEEFRSFLNSKHQIICITGHIHEPIQDLRSIWQDKCTVIQAPVNAVGNLCVEIKNQNMTVVPENFYSQALLIDVFEDEVLVYGIDLIAKDIVNKPWVISTKRNSLHRYTNERYQNASDPRFYEFEPQIIYENHKLKVKFEHAVCEENAEGDMVLYYIVEIVDNEGNIILSENIVSDFYHYEKKNLCQFERDIYLEGLNYIKITPVSCFGKHGEMVECTVYEKQKD